MYPSTLSQITDLGPGRFAEALEPAPDRWCAMRSRIARAARAELARWRGRGGRVLHESDPGQLRILAQYWSAVPGFSTPRAALAAARRSAADDPAFPWSAAFICFVMRQAGVRPADGFVFGRRHMEYIVGALRNRERSDHTRPFWLVDHVELQHEAPPERGDLLCFNRGGSHHTYSSLRRSFWSGGHETARTSGISHCRAVVGTGISGGRRFIDTIGGNESNSVRLTRIAADRFGNIPHPQALRIFGMIKLIECQRPG
jgi:hypothetical protein